MPRHLGARGAVCGRSLTPLASKLRVEGLERLLGALEHLRPRARVVAPTRRKSRPALRVYSCASGVVCLREAICSSRGAK